MFKAIYDQSLEGQRSKSLRSLRRHQSLFIFSLTQHFTYHRHNFELFCSQINAAPTWPPSWKEKQGKNSSSDDSKNIKWTAMRCQRSVYFSMHFTLPTHLGKGKHISQSQISRVKTINIHIQHSQKFISTSQRIWVRYAWGRFYTLTFSLLCKYGVLHWGEASVGLLCHKVPTGGGSAAIVAFVELSPISLLHLWSSATVIFGFFFTSLTQTLLPWLLSLAGWPGLRRVLVIPNFFHYRIMEAALLLVTLSVSEKHNCALPPFCLWAPSAVPSTSRFSFALTCTASCKVLYRQVRAAPNQVQSF